MIITCINGGLLPDFNKCIPYGEHDLAMYIKENVYFVFYDILDCRTQSRFSLSTFLDIDKDARITKEELDFRLDYFRRHEKALIYRALRNVDDSIFFNSIESEVLSKYFHEMKFTCKVDIFIDNKQVQLEEIKDKDENYERILEFIDFFNICEYINVREYVDIKQGIFVPKREKKKSLIKNIVAGTAGLAVGVFIGHKLSNKINISSITTEEKEA